LFLRELLSNSKRQAKKLCLYIVFIFAISQPLASCTALRLPLLAVIHRLLPIEESQTKTNKNYPQIAVIPASKVDKIRLTNKQIKQFNSLALQLSSGSITMEEAILQLRGADRLTDIVGVIAFVIFVNCYNSFFSVEAFHANPLQHKDPFGWFSAKYESKNTGYGQSLSHLPS